MYLDELFSQTNELEGLAKEELIALVMELQNERNELVGQLERNEVPCFSRYGFLDPSSCELNYY